MANSPFNRASLEAMALAQAGMKSPAPVKPPVRTPAARKPFVYPDKPVTSQYDQAKALYDQEVAAAALQNKAKLAIADRLAVPYQSLAESAKSLPGQITAGYDAAAGKSEAFTSAYSQAFRDESAKLQAQNGAENRGAGLGDALAFMGSLPARGYRDSGSGLAEAARFLPTTVGARGLDAVTEARTTENTAYAKLLSELSSASGKRLLDAAQQDRTFGLDREKFKYTQRKDADALELSNWKAETAVELKQIDQALAQAKADVDAKYKNGILSLREYSIETSHIDRLAGISAQNARSAASITAADSRSARTISAANARARASLEAKDASGTAKGALTANQITQLVNRFYNGVPKSTTTIALDENKKPILKPYSNAPETITQTTLEGQMDYNAAYKTLMATPNMTDYKARTYLNAAYKLGDRGRGWILREARDVLAKAGLPVAAKVVKGHPLLSVPQMKVLQRAGLLPPGTLTKSGYAITGETPIPKPDTEARRGGREDASYSVPGVTLRPGADRPGATTAQPVFDFLGRVAQITGSPITITTGTAHDQYVEGTKRQSEHWNGYGADVAAYGDDLIRLGQAALIAAGMDEQQARSETGDLFNLNGYQVIFNTHKGGDHTDHLHVGVGRAGTA